MVKHTQTIRWLLPSNWLSVFHHFVVLVLKGLMSAVKKANGKVALFLLVF